MWLGLLYLPAADDGATVILCAWAPGRERAVTCAGPLSAAPQMVRAFREVGRRTVLDPPRCDACATALEVPSL